MLASVPFKISQRVHVAKRNYYHLYHLYLTWIHLKLEQRIMQDTMKHRKIRAT